ncbi:MAG: nucleotidyltransferase domain-containing protein [Desulfobulbaceae bacterium]|nr:nucleotidyltransferase domain-containing protein [Desulfobulbaceae bacterium]
MQPDISDLKNSLAPVFQAHRDTLIFGYLFGSRATEEENQKSDIDIAVFVDEPSSFSFSDRLLLHGEFCRKLRRNDIDLIILNQANNLILLDQIIRSGIVIWDSDPSKREEFELRLQHVVIDFKYQRTKEMGL